MSNKVREKRYYISGPTEKNARLRHIFIMLGLLAEPIIVLILLLVVDMPIPLRLLFIAGGVLPVLAIISYVMWKTVIAFFFNYFTVVGDTLVIKRYKLTTRRINISEIKMLKIGKSDDPDKGGSIISRWWRDLAVINHAGSVLFYVIDDAEVVAFFQGLGIQVDRFDPGAPTNFSGRYQK